MLTTIWKRLTEEDTRSLEEATRGTRTEQSTAASSSALTVKSEDLGRLLDPPESYIGNILIAADNDRSETFVDEWISYFEGYSYPVSGAVPVSSGAFPMSHREKLDPPIFRELVSAVR